MTHKRRTGQEIPVTPPNSTSQPQPEPGSSHIPIAPNVIRDRLMAPAISARYASSPQLLQRVEFRTGKSSDILVLKRSADSEFILRGVYQIARNDFYFTPDGNFDPANSFGSRFQDVKLSCLLAAPISPEFEFAQEDYPACIENLRGLEKLIKHGRDDELLSSVTEHLNTFQFKLSHALFEPKPIAQNAPSNEPEESDNQNHDSDTLASTTDDDTLGFDFAMESWPVAPRCVAYLEELYETHDICPLPAYDTKGILIPPSDYETALKGATVEAHFTFAHHLIKRSKRHVYTTLLRRLEVLRAPGTLPSSPFKRLRVRATAGTGKSRA